MSRPAGHEAGNDDGTIHAWDELAEGPETYTSVFDMDADGTEVWWDGWVEGFDRGMRLRPRTWEPILKNGASEASMALDLLYGLCRLVQGGDCPGLIEAIADDIDRLANNLIPRFVTWLNAWKTGAAPSGWEKCESRNFERRESRNPCHPSPHRTLHQREKEQAGERRAEGDLGDARGPDSAAVSPNAENAGHHRCDRARQGDQGDRNRMAHEARQHRKEQGDADLVPGVHAVENHDPCHQQPCRDRKREGPGHRHRPPERAAAKWTRHIAHRSFPRAMGDIESSAAHGNA